MAREPGDYTRTFVRGLLQLLSQAREEDWVVFTEEISNARDSALIQAAVARGPMRQLPPAPSDRPVFDTDDMGRILAINEAVTREFGYTIEQVRRRTLRTVLHHGELPCASMTTQVLMPVVRGTLGTERPSCIVDHGFTSDGRRRWYVAEYWSLEPAKMSRLICTMLSDAECVEQERTLEQAHRKVRHGGPRRGSGRVTGVHNQPLEVFGRKYMGWWEASGGQPKPQEIAWALACELQRTQTLVGYRLDYGFAWPPNEENWVWYERQIGRPAKRPPRQLTLSQRAEPFKHTLAVAAMAAFLLLMMDGWDGRITGYLTVALGLCGHHFHV